MNFRSDEDVRADDDVRTEFMPFIQSQYSASTRIISILESCREHILPDADIVSFFDNIFNIETASGVQSLMSSCARTLRARWLARLL